MDMFKDKFIRYSHLTKINKKIKYVLTFWFYENTYYTYAKKDIYIKHTEFIIFNIFFLRILRFFKIIKDMYLKRLETILKAYRFH